VDAATSIITTVAGNGTEIYFGVAQGGDGKLATAAAVWTPTGISLDAAGNIYVAEPWGSVIRRVDAVTGIISTVAGNAARDHAGNGGPATKAMLNLPNDVVIAPQGQIVIADSRNQVLRIVNCSAPGKSCSMQIASLACQVQCNPCLSHVHGSTDEHRILFEASHSSGVVMQYLHRRHRRCPLPLLPEM
jgi:hypothetical protein